MNEILAYFLISGVVVLGLLFGYIFSYKKQQEWEKKEREEILADFRKMEEKYRKDKP